MAYSESLADRIRTMLGRQAAIEEKKMFGGVGFLLNGNLLVGVWKTSLVARIGTEQYDEALAEEHVRKFDITGREMRGWVLVDGDGVESGEQLRSWIDRATNFVRELPGK